jgi:hypothetical protein
MYWAERLELFLRQGVVSSDDLRTLNRETSHVGSFFFDRSLCYPMLLLCYHCMEVFWSTVRILTFWAKLKQMCFIFDMAVLSESNNCSEWKGFDKTSYREATLRLRWQFHSTDVFGNERPWTQTSDFAQTSKIICNAFNYLKRQGDWSQACSRCCRVSISRSWCMLSQFFFFHWLLESSFGPSPPLIFLFPNLFRHMVGLLGRVISPSQGLCLHRTI